MRDEVLPYVPDAWVDHARTKIGYEIPLTRHFYKYVPPRPLEEIDAEIKALEDEIQRLLARGGRMRSRTTRLRMLVDDRSLSADRSLNEARGFGCSYAMTIVRRWHPVID